MNTGLSTDNPAIVSAFRAALLHQGLLVLLLFALVALAWNIMRSVQLRQQATRLAAGAYATSSPPPAPRPPAPELPAPEPVARRLLRVSFGLLWIFDGILQGQASMPLGMVPQVVEPAAAGSPGWAQHLVNAAATIWSYHPVTAAAAAVWVQVGIGAWLLAAPRGNWSRLAGAASVGWGLVVWVFGETFGGVLGPGLSWLLGAPGAVLFYCSTGALVALPERAWAGVRLGRAVLRLMGSFFVGMAVLQAWPGRGFWQGRAGPGRAPGTLTAAVQQMAGTPQPRLVASWVATFERFDTAHGWAVNLFSVVVLAAIGATFLSARPRLARIAVAAATVLCLADWVLVEDLGFMGGVGTDPNSMVPMALVLITGYLALTRATAPTTAADEAGPAVAPVPGPVSRAPAIASLRASLRDRLTADPTYTLRSVAAIGSIGTTLVGAVPMAAAAIAPHADPILAEAVEGAPQRVDGAAPAFDLTDQHGRAVGLSSLRGKTVVLTFLDDTCTTDCPVIAQELLSADTYLGGSARRVEIVAINANPRYVAPDYLAAFDAQEGLEHVANWLFLTGSLPQLRSVWRSYGEPVLYQPGGAMIAHSEYAWVIDGTGRTRYILDTGPGPATSATEASFSVMLARTVMSVLGK
jgi:cytochrome oxidase Cu insertion factor (SCO1/SenC/PrrC family)